ncbi:TetR/AcrR family transcriptional regulator [Bailinhaonella thermotolerans]|uniref:TetR/AcrR family transcriptional regulator n=2 Tax=Bailinhaonella thermotolerans TaxID=1070861 RepID=A0A3A4AQN4_9ACTN|nr:TetR/AcrR family transcriptional regulator [Bailinhaonella thermotolerans]
MAEEGAASLSLSAIARRLGIQPPSLYKYFPSRHAVYDALFALGQRRYRDVIAEAAARAEPPGLAQVAAAFEAGGRWIMDNQILAQLLFWRPVPGFTPSPESYGPALETRDLYAGMVRAAVERGELAPAAAGEEGLNLLASLITGPMSQQMANGPEATFDTGAYTRLLARMPALFAAAYPPS